MNEKEIFKKEVIWSPFLDNLFFITLIGLGFLAGIIGFLLVLMLGIFVL